MTLVRKMQDRWGIFGELVAFLWAEKLWWMIPFVGLLVVFGLLMVFGAQSGLAPFVYPFI